MYEFRGFTQKANKALNLSIESAQNFGHDYIGTEHILLGLIKEGSGVAAAGGQAQNHDESQQHSHQFFHVFSSLLFFTGFKGYACKSHNFRLRCPFPCLYGKLNRFQSQELFVSFPTICRLCSFCERPVVHFDGDFRL